MAEPSGGGFNLSYLLSKMGYDSTQINVLIDLFRENGMNPDFIIRILRSQLTPELIDNLYKNLGVFEEDFDNTVRRAIAGSTAVSPVPTTSTKTDTTTPAEDAARAALERAGGGLTSIGNLLNNVADLADMTKGYLDAVQDTGGKGTGKAGGGSFIPASVEEMSTNKSVVPSVFGGLARDMFLGQDPGAAVEFLLQESGFRGPQMIRDFLTDQGDFFSALAGLTLLENHEPGVRFDFIKTALADFLGGHGGVTGLSNVRRLVSELDLNSPEVSSLLDNDVFKIANFMGTVLAPFLPDVILSSFFGRANLRRQEIQYKAALANGYTGNAMQWLVDQGIVPWLSKSGQTNAQGRVASPTATPFIPPDLTPVETAAATTTEGESQ